MTNEKRAGIAGYAGHQGLASQAQASSQDQGYYDQRALVWPFQQSMQQAQLGQQLGHQSLNEQSLGNALMSGEALMQQERVAKLEAVLFETQKQNAVLQKELQRRARPSVHDLARALWSSDERVFAKAAEVGDYMLHGSPHPFSYDSQQRAIVLQKMWARNEGNWRTQAYERAEMVLTCLETPSVMACAPEAHDLRVGFNGQVK